MDSFWLNACTNGSRFRCTDKIDSSILLLLFDLDLDFEFDDLFDRFPCPESNDISEALTEFMFKILFDGCSSLYI